MNIFKDIVLSIILILFPILIYFVVICYKRMKNSSSKLLFYLTIFSSTYMCLKLSNIEYLDKIVLFCNIPIIISYLKKETCLGIVISLYLVIFCYFNLEFNLYILLIKYFLYFIIYLYFMKKSKLSNDFILVIAILQGFFISFEYFFKNNIDINLIFSFFFLILLFYLIPFVIIFLFNLIDNISHLYVSLEELEKEKQIRTSLFKITHEIKNPIAVCKGYIDMFDVNNKEKSIKYISIIKDELGHCLNIIGDFMELSKIKINLELMDINMLLNEVCLEFKLLLDNRIIFNYQVLDDDIYIMGDYKRLKQVLLNVLKNSVESITNNGNILVNTYINNNNYYITIEDNGIGMDSDTLNKVKESFFTTKKNGTGLGVPLSNEIIIAHNGKLNYDSSLNFGTKVTIILPISM